MADQIFITVGVDIDDATLASESAKAGATAGKSFGSKFADASRKGAGAADEIFKDIEATVKRIRGFQANIGKTGLDPGQFAPLERGLTRLLALQRQFSADREKLSRNPAFLNLLRRETEAVQALTSSQTRELQSTVAATNVQERARAHAAERDLALRNIQAQRDSQLQINAARTAGKARIVLAQQIGAQLLSAERIISNGITNIIRGTSKAVSAVWQSTVGSLRRTFSERKTIVEGGLRNESRLFTQSTIISQKANTGIVGAISNNLGAIGGGLALGAGIRQIFTLGSEFTRGLNVLQAQLGLTAEQMKEVDALSIQLGNDISLPGVSALDAASAIGLLAKQFAALGPAAIGAAEAAAQGTLQLARAVGAAPEEAAQTVGAAVNVFGEKAENATRVADQLAGALSQAAGTSFTDFSQAFTQGASVVSSFITPADGATQAITEFSAALAILARGGLIGSDAGTSIKQFFLQANRGTDEVSTALAEISARAGETGTAFFTAEGQSRSLAQTIDILQRGLVGLTEEQRASTLQTVFGSDATRVANILIGQGAAELLKAEDAVNRQGTAAALAAAQNKGLAGAIDAIKSQFETFAIQIFKKVNPVLGDAGLKVADFIDKLANGEGAFATFRKAILGIAAALGTIVALRGFTEIVGIISSIVSLLGPFGVGIAIVGAVAGIATGGFRNFGDTLSRLQDIVRTVTGLIQTGLGLAVRFLAAQFERIRPIIQPVIQRFGDLVKRLQQLGTSLKLAFQFGGLSGAFRVLKFELGRLAGDIGSVLAPIGKKLVDALAPVGALAIGIRDRVVAAFRSIDFAAIVSTVGSTISKVLSTTLGRTLTGAGIGAVAGGVIAGPLGVALGAAFGAAIAFAIPKLRDAISRIDVGALFGKFLQGVSKVGETIGKIISSKNFILGVAGIAAAAAAIGAQFVIGFVKGVVGNLGQVADAGAAILNALFDQGSVVKSLLAIAIVFRRVLASGFFNAVKSDAKKTGQAIGKELAQGTAEGVQQANIGGKITGFLKTAGSKAGSALAVGLSAGLAGSALGSAKGDLEKSIGLTSVLASVAAGGAAFGAPGAAVAGGIALVTTALSANAKKAEEAKARMSDFRQAMIDTGSVAGGVAKQIDTLFSGTGIDTISKQLLSLTTFTTEGFTKAIQQGKADQFLKDINQQLLESGVNVSLVSKVMGDLRKQVKGAADAAKDLELTKALDPKKFDTGALKTGLANIVTQFKEAVRQKNQLAADIRAEQLIAKAKTIEAGMKAIGDAADVSRQKILDLANPPPAKTAKQGGAEATTGVAAIAPDITQAFLTGLDTALGSAQLENAIASLSGPLGSAVQDGLGNAFTPEQIATNLAQVKAAINQAVQPDGTAVPDAVKQKLLEGVAAFEAANVPLIIEEQTVADLRTASAAGDAIADATLASKGLSSGISVKSKADLAAALTSGGDIIASADSIVQNLPTLVPSEADKGKASAAGSEIHSTVQKNADKPVKVGSVVSVSSDSTGNRAGNSIAKSVLDGFTAGLRSSSASVTKTVTSVVNGVTQTAKAVFGIHSPSTVFMGIGEDVMSGLEEGIKSGGANVLSAIDAVATAMIDATRTVANSIPSALTSLFQNSLSGGAVRGGGNTASAVSGFNEAIHDVFFQVASNFDTLWQAASKEAGQRSLEENMLLFFGEKNNSLSASTVFGRANIAAVTKAVDSIKSIGDALLEQGLSAQQVTDQLLNYRNALIQLSVQAGIAGPEVAALVDSLGLSGASLADFVAQANKLNQVIAEGQRRAAIPPPTPTPLTPGPNAAQTFILNNEFATPFDDPEAVSLAVVNRLAQSVRR